jgi:hypothetical protein
LPRERSPHHPPKYWVWDTRPPQVWIGALNPPKYQIPGK